MIIETNDNFLKINNISYPRGMFMIMKMSDRIRLDFIATNEKTDISAPVIIDGMEYTNLNEIESILQLYSFKKGGVTSEWVTDRIINAQLEGQEVDLSMYAKKTDLFDMKIHITQVKATEGVWSCNFPEGKFTEPPFVVPIALNDDKTSKNRANFASLDNGTTITQCKGLAKSCVSGGVLVAMEMGNSDCFVNIIAIGK